MDVHTTMYENKWLHGMEVCNGDTYYPDAHKWCLEKNLTMLGSSDIHDPDLRHQSTPDDHRTMTLAFVKVRTQAALKDALQEGRTAVWFKDQIIGREELLRPLFHECVRVAVPHLHSGNNAFVEVRNLCHADIRLERTGNDGPLQIALPAKTTSLLKLAVKNPKEPVELEYKVTSFLIAPDAALPVTLRIPTP